MEYLSQFIAGLFLIIAIVTVFLCCIRPNVHLCIKTTHVSSVAAYSGAAVGFIALIAAGLIVFVSLPF